MALPLDKLRKNIVNVEIFPAETVSRSATKGRGA
jgi:hypothetical protein